MVEQNSDPTGSLLRLEIPAFSRRRGVVMLLVGAAGFHGILCVSDSRRKGIRWSRCSI